MKTMFIRSLLLLALCLYATYDRVEALESKSDKKKVLVGSPIRQKPPILKEFLDSLNRLEQTTYETDYYFIDDNVIPESHQLLNDFAKSAKGKCLIDVADTTNSPEYVCDENTHHWKEEIVWKVAAFKDKMIQHARDKGYDYLFLVDSDMILHPKTMEQLISDDKEIVSNIFWSRWLPTLPLNPNAWVSDQYNLFYHEIGEQLSHEERLRRTQEFLGQLRKPGVYQVGGLCACTLINKTALNKGVSFKRISNLTLWGEDRHFCTRAVALGIPLYIDTHYPSYHIYRDSEFPGVKDYILACTTTEKPRHRLTLSMIMRDEADHYLRRVLESAREYITDAVIIDDASVDNSVAICQEVLQGIPLVIVRNPESKFSNEVELRKQQWEETIKTNPEWIIVLDADQIVEDRLKDQVQELLSATDVDAYYFRLYDMWDEEHYREDKCWKAHSTLRPFIFRYKPGLQYVWKNTPQHCGSFPLTIMSFPYEGSYLRVKHYGWAKPADRVAKYERYQKLDPGAKYGWKEQYESALDPKPNLLKWVE